MGHRLGVEPSAIHQLPPDVAAKIAAGEVVERPASVVKELIENSLDAGARHIRVELAGGGLELIRVTDDGRGVGADEMPLAFSRHATSKIGSIADLDSIHTLGFRGEALASISAVARVTLTSRRRDDAVGAQLVADEGALGAVTPAGAPVGTTLIVRGLFSSVPARLKFLKTRATETGHSLRLLEQYALAYPEVRFTALSEGRQVFHTPGDGDLRNAITAVYGLSVAEQMLPIGESVVSDDDPGGADTTITDATSGEVSDRPRVSGYISRPTCYKATRQFLSFFVNRRWVQSRSLSFAVEEAYHSLLLTGRHPVVVVNVTLDPSLLDVNVHPAKTEVRFLRERQVYAAVQRATRAALLATAAAPDVSPRVFAVPNWEAPTEQPFTGVSPWDDTPDDATHPADGAAMDAPGVAPGRIYQRAPTGQAGEGVWTPDMLSASPQATDAARSGADDSDLPAGGRTQAAQTPLWRDRTLGADGLRRPTQPVADGFRLPGPLATAPVGGKKFPPLRVMGQVAQSYILAEGPDGVYLVDQHAAHERILLDRMVAEWRARAVASQLLLEPLVIELAPDERDAVEDHLAALRAIGFALELRDDATADTLIVRATPGALSRELREQPLRDLLLALVGADAEAASHGETWEEHALANVACKAAIKAGQTLNPAEQRALIEQLEAAHASLSCCHGRPTMIHLSLAALEREFDRR